MCASPVPGTGNSQVVPCGGGAGGEGCSDGSDYRQRRERDREI